MIKTFKFINIEFVKFKDFKEYYNRYLNFKNKYNKLKKENRLLTQKIYYYENKKKINKNRVDKGFNKQSYRGVKNESN